MNTTISILCYPNPNSCDSNLAGLAGYMGLDYKFVKPDDLFTDFDNQSIHAVALSGKSLEAIFRNDQFAGFLIKILDSFSSVFLYDLSPGQTFNDALNIFSGGIIHSVTTLPNDNLSYSVNEQHRDISRQFSGLTFGPVNSEVDFVFKTGKTTPDSDTIISIDGRPMFMRIKRGGCNIFALATGIIQDVNGVENGPVTTAKHFSALAPVLMYLKYAFGDSCWHPSASQACLTIDDPLLHKKYGFIDYKELLKTMRKERFFTTLAFIPWNYRRSQPGVVELFKNNSDVLSICVHGCDHTAGEFGVADFAKADDKVKLATRRMTAHWELTGLAYDKVMIFPQGIFSTISLKALKANGYEAAVNSGIFPVYSSPGLKVSDMMQQSILSHESFPLFHRHYPVSIVDFAFDLFLGKPALIVTHHEHFRAGYEEISGFIRKLNSLDSNIRWRGLGEIARKSYWLKRESDTQISVRMGSNALHIENSSTKRVRYSITRYETNDIPLDGVFVNGREVTYTIAEQLLKIEIGIEPQASADVAIKYQNPRSDSPEERTASERVKIFVRRHLSEFRDNYVSKSRFLQAVARKVNNLR